MNQVLFLLDGITLQKAGELFFETEETWTEQQACPLSYRRSLEDFAEAILFGKGLAIGRDLPEIALGIRPGDYLRSYLGEFAHPIDDAERAGQPADLLSIPTERANMVDLISQLRNIVNLPDFAFWKELAIRESRHVGTDAKILRRQEDPAAYRYQKRFNEDPQLGAAVPIEYLEPIVAWVRKTQTVNQAVDGDALRIFFAENAVTHILNFWWYKKVVPKVVNDPMAVYQPHATRSAFTPPQAEHYRMELPATLGPILRKADRPIDVLDELLCTALKRYHRDLGGCLGEVCEHGANGDMKEATIAAERGTLLARSREKTTAIRLSISPLSMKSERREDYRAHRGTSAAEPSAPIFSPQPSESIPPTEYEQDLIRLFGPRRGSLVTVPANYERVAAENRRPPDNKVWYDFLASRFQYWQPLDRKKIKDFVGQFPPELTDGVLKMLRSVRVYTDGDFDFHYRSFFRRNPGFFNGRTAVCPLDMKGGSAFLMQYMSSHSVGTVQHVSNLHEALKLQQENHINRVVLLDDAAISGTQASEIFDEYLGLGQKAKHVRPLDVDLREIMLQGQVEVRLLFLFADVSRKEKLAHKLRLSYPKLDLQVETITPIDGRALFRDRGYVFGLVSDKARAFFEEVGYSILRNRAVNKYPLEPEKQDEYRRKNAIGFGDNQLLVVYSYNIPKATVTLLWEGGVFEGRDWTPLFPERRTE